MIFAVPLNFFQGGVRQAATRRGGHNRDRVNDAPYNLAQPMAVPTADQQNDPVEEHKDDVVEQEQINEHVTRELPPTPPHNDDRVHINDSDASDVPSGVNPIDQAGETSGAIPANPSTIGDQNKATDPQIHERREHKPSPSSPPVAIAVSSKHHASTAGPTTSTYEVRSTRRLSRSHILCSIFKDTCYV